MERTAVSEGVEASTEENILTDSIGDGLCERVFRVSTARHEERAKCNGEGAVGTRRSAAKLFVKRRAKDGNGDGVVENKRLRVVKLVRCATQGHAECGSRWAGVLHEGAAIRLGDLRFSLRLSFAGRSSFGSLSRHPAQRLGEVLLHLLARNDGVEE